MEFVLGPLVWLDPIPVKSLDGKKKHLVKLLGVVSYGEKPPCGLGGAYSSVASVVDWVNAVTRNCNNQTCDKDECVTKDKLKQQALFLFHANVNTPVRNNL